MSHDYLTAADEVPPEPIRTPDIFQNYPDNEDDASVINNPPQKPFLLKRRSSTFYKDALLKNKSIKESVNGAAIAVNDERILPDEDADNQTDKSDNISYQMNVGYNKYRSNSNSFYKNNEKNQNQKQNDEEIITTQINGISFGTDNDQVNKNHLDNYKYNNNFYNNKKGNDNNLNTSFDTNFQENDKSFIVSGMSSSIISPVPLSSNNILLCDNSSFDNKDIKKNHLIDLNSIDKPTLLKKNSFSYNDFKRKMYYDKY
ncbi:uncharacterized protein ASCRUDRAFT_71241 [Ascoidea rubescens DSM 1968]|uniref:Uncharacterized protein n=1 Tax=Ascoidea rubescens DSM 1968 TaxID=1344418 RepID=A0A1D2VEW3_9ASCO|nr:hypothetical protein ASCRUDRAFT_71241 [Ascoidea rubescens DSM 1968]ODV60214.1 hypothetical protein ASCRUDRAFT_71241 [Ascoidea rubescens DSM 1968]